MKRYLFATVAAVTLIMGAGVTTSALADDWHGHHNDHDWNKGRNWDNHRSSQAYYYYPRPYYTAPRDRVVYVQPPHTVYYSQTYASPSTTTTTYYPDGYSTTTYTVGQYLPDNRVWHPMPDYVRYGLRSPGRGQRWVGNGRDALLISEATSRILSGVLLATYIN